MKDGRKLLARAGRAAAAAGLLPHAQPAHHRRRHAGAEVGLHQRLHRGRAGQARLRLDDRRPHLRHLPRARRASPTRRSASCRRRCRSSPSRISTTGGPGCRYDEIYTGWAYPPKDYAKWARAGLPVGEALRRAVRPRRSRDVVLGGLERAEHRLLAGHAGGVPQAARLRRSTPCAARCRRRASAGRTSAGSGGAFMRDFLEHCLRGTNYATGETGTPLDFVAFHAKGAPTFVDGHVRMGIANQLRTIDDGFAIDRVVPGAEEQADRHRRVRPRRLRRLPGAAARLSQRHDVLELHRRQLRPQARPGRRSTA